MKMKANFAVEHIKIYMHISLRTILRFSLNHPLLSSLVFLLFLVQRIFPSFFAFLVSSSPVFLLTGLLLGCLLSYGQADIPEIGKPSKSSFHAFDLSAENSSAKHDGEDIIRAPLQDELLMKDNSKLDLSAENSSAMHDVEDIIAAPLQDEIILKDNKKLDLSPENSSAKHDVEDIDGTPLQDEFLMEDINKGIAFDNASSDADEKLVTIVDTSFYKDSSLSSDSQLLYDESMTVVESEAHYNQTTNINEANLEDGGLKSRDSADNCFIDIFGAAWKPLPTGKHAELDSESELAESSESDDDSITDIIPMLHELDQHLEVKQTDATGSAENSDDSENSDDESVSEDDENDTCGNRHNLIDKDENFCSIYDENRENCDGDEDSLLLENDNGPNNIFTNEHDRMSDSRSLIERRKGRKSVSFDLDRIERPMCFPVSERVKDFPVRIPHIATPRPKPSEFFDDSEETLGLPKIPDSAPSAISYKKSNFGLVNYPVERCSSQTNSPRAYVSLKQQKFSFSQGKHVSCWKPSYVARLDEFKQCKYDLKIKHSDHKRLDDGAHLHVLSDAEKPPVSLLFGSLDHKIGEELKILSSAFSEAGKLDMSYDEADEDLTTSGHVLKQVSLDSEYPEVNFFSTTVATLENEDGPSKLQLEQLHVELQNSVTEAGNSDLHVTEARSLDDINSLFRKAGTQRHVSHPVLETNVHRNGWTETLFNDDEHALLEDDTNVITAARRDHFQEDKDGLHVLEHESAVTSTAPVEDDDGKTLSGSELHVVEANSIEKLNYLFKQIQEQSHENIAAEAQEHDGHQSNEMKLTPQSSELHAVEASSLQELSFLINRVQEHVCCNDSSPDLSTENNQLYQKLPLQPLIRTTSSDLNLVEATSVEQILILFKQLEEAPKTNAAMQELSQSEHKLREFSTFDFEQSESLSKVHLLETSKMGNAASPVETAMSSELHVVEASTVEQIKSLFKQLSEAAHISAASEGLTSSEINSSEPLSSLEMHVTEASSVEEIKLRIDDCCQESQEASAEIHCDNAMKLDATPLT